MSRILSHPFREKSKIRQKLIRKNPLFNAMLNVVPQCFNQIQEKIKKLILQNMLGVKIGKVDKQIYEQIFEGHHYLDDEKAKLFIHQHLESLRNQLDQVGLKQEENKIKLAFFVQMVDVQKRISQDFHELREQVKTQYPGPEQQDYFREENKDMEKWRAQQHLTLEMMVQKKNQLQGGTVPKSRNTYKITKKKKQQKKSNEKKWKNGGAQQGKGRKDPDSEQKQEQQLNSKGMISL